MPDTHSTGQPPIANSYPDQCIDRAKVWRPCSTCVSSYFIHPDGHGTWVKQSEMETQVLAHARRSQDGAPSKYDAESHALLLPAWGGADLEGCVEDGRR